MRRKMWNRQRAVNSEAVKRIEIDIESTMIKPRALIGTENFNRKTRAWAGTEFEQQPVSDKIDNQ